MAQHVVSVYMLRHFAFLKVQNFNLLLFTKPLNYLCVLWVCLG